MQPPREYLNQNVIILFDWNWNYYCTEYPIINNHQKVFQFERKFILSTLDTLVISGNFYRYKDVIFSLSTWLPLKNKGSYLDSSLLRLKKNDYHHKMQDFQ